MMPETLTYFSTIKTYVMKKNLLLLCVLPGFVFASFKSPARKVAFSGVGETLQNSSQAPAQIDLTCTSGGSNYSFQVPAGTTITNQTTIAEGTYNISISPIGPNSMYVEHCDLDLYGSPAASTPYTYTGYNTDNDGNLVVVLWGTPDGLDLK